jgi:hypothetical protein
MTNNTAVGSHYGLISAPIGGQCHGVANFLAIKCDHGVD